MKTLFILLVIFVGVLLSCKKKVQPELLGAQNACDCIQETTADFTINEVTGTNLPGEWMTETDTCYADRDVRFIAKMEEAEYIWYIGSEILTEKSVGRNFSLAQGGQDIPITLVVKKKPNTICFPNDDGYDSITKILHVANYTSNLMTLDTTFIEGSYRFFNPEINDSIDIIIDLFYEHIQYTGNGVKIIGFHGLGDTVQTDEVQKSFRELRIFKHMIGNFHVHLDGLVTFDFLDKTVIPNKTYALKGRKL